MDAYSMTCNSPTLRHKSLIYQDLRSIPFRGISGLNPPGIKQAMESVNAKPKVRCYLDLDTLNKVPFAFRGTNECLIVCTR